jgi:hypothetical protein
MAGDAAARPLNSRTGIAATGNAAELQKIVSALVTIRRCADRRLSRA